MSKLPIVSAKTIEKLLLKLGFRIERQKGSHRFYKHPDGRYVTVPHHSGEDLSRPLTRAILRELKLEPEEFIRLLKEI